MLLGGSPPSSCSARSRLAAAPAPPPSSASARSPTGGARCPQPLCRGDVFVYAKAREDENFDVYYQRVEGGSPIDLTEESPVADTQPAFSPDGRQIAFRSERDGGGIFLMGATGESVRRLTTGGYNPAWSPDGSKIVYATEGIDYPLRRSTAPLWRVRVADGSGAASQSATPCIGCRRTRAHRLWGSPTARRGGDLTSGLGAPRAGDDDCHSTDPVVARRPLALLRTTARHPHLGACASGGVRQGAPTRAVTTPAMERPAQRGR